MAKTNAALPYFDELINALVRIKYNTNHCIIVLSPLIYRQINLNTTPCVCKQFHAHITLMYTKNASQRVERIKGYNVLKIKHHTRIILFFYQYKLLWNFSRKLLSSLKCLQIVDLYSIQTIRVFIALTVYYIILYYMTIIS